MEMGHDMDKKRVNEIIGTNRRFISPFDEPCGYSIFGEKITKEDISLYFEKLKYMAEHADELIEKYFSPEYYDFYGIDKEAVSSPEMMCNQLIIESFVLVLRNHSISIALSNKNFMCGNYIEYNWFYNWEFWCKGIF